MLNPGHARDNWSFYALLHILTGAYVGIFLMFQDVAKCSKQRLTIS